MPPQLRSKTDTRSTTVKGEVDDELAAVESMVQPEPAVIRIGNRRMVIRHVELPPPPVQERKKTVQRVEGYMKELPENQAVVQIPSSRKGGGPSWKPVPYQEALKLQQTWRDNRWCLPKIRNEFIGDKQLEQSGTGASEILEFREKLLKAYTDLVGSYLAVQTEIGVLGEDVPGIVGAKFAYSKVEAIIGPGEAKKLKEAHARITTQVHVWKQTWYQRLTPVSIARAINAAQ